MVQLKVATAATASVSILVCLMMVLPHESSQLRWLCLNTSSGISVYNMEFYHTIFCLRKDNLGFYTKATDDFTHTNTILYFVTKDITHSNEIITLMSVWVLEFLWLHPLGRHKNSKSGEALSYWCYVCQELHWLMYYLVVIIHSEGEVCREPIYILKSLHCAFVFTSC